jgi:membrane-associated PAP2 superfamily phosphatase
MVGIASLIWSRLSPYRRAGFFFAAVLALGPGLLINSVFKAHWGRPRPRQTVEFGGNLPFVSVWVRTSLSKSRSFPSGHASMGFYLMAPAFLLYRRRRGLALAFVFVGLLSGGYIGLARVVQGAHFPSDVVWSAGMVYLSGLVLVYVFDLRRPSYRVAEPDETSEFAPVVIAPDTDVPTLADRPPSPREEGDRRKAA